MKVDSDFELNAVRDGKEKMLRWLQAREDKERADSDANRASCELSNAASDLAKWMLPTDAKPGEKVLMWCRDALIQAELVGMNDVRVTVRTPGKVVRP